MRVFARKMAYYGVERLEVEQDLGIVIEHNGKTYSINTDNNDVLYLSSNAADLIVLPSASNRIILEQK